jgi:hypothetical protein
MMRSINTVYILPPSVKFLDSKGVYEYKNPALSSTWRRQMPILTPPLKGQISTPAEIRQNFEVCSKVEGKQFDPLRFKPTDLATALNDMEGQMVPCPFE